MTSTLLLILACTQDPTPPTMAVADVVSADPAGLVTLLRGPLGVPDSRLARLQARIGAVCAVVVDPADPADCDPLETCMATSFSAPGGDWQVSAIAHVGTLPDAERCGDAGDLGPLPGLPR